MFHTASNYDAHNPEAGATKLSMFTHKKNGFAPFTKCLAANVSLTFHVEQFLSSRENWWIICFFPQLFRPSGMKLQQAQGASYKRCIREENTTWLSSQWIKKPFHRLWESVSQSVVIPFLVLSSSTKIFVLRTEKFSIKSGMQIAVEKLYLEAHTRSCPHKSRDIFGGRKLPLTTTNVYKQDTHLSQTRYA